MSTHRRAWIQRAGVVLALAASAIFTLPASPALAAPELSNVYADPSRVEAGKSTIIRYDLAVEDTADIEVTSNNPNLRCISGCQRKGAKTQNGLEAKFELAASFTSDREINAKITITATSKPPLIGTDTQSVDITLIGKPPAPQTVKSISGQVTNSANGDPVEGATVMIKDSGGHTYTDTTDRNGRYSFTGSEQKPITPGAIQIGAVKEDAQSRISTINVGPGQSFTHRIALELPEPTPSPTETVEPTPSELVEPSETAEELPTGLPQTNNAATQEEGGGMGWLFIVLGGLLVALGVGAIVLLLMKRKEGDEEEADDDDSEPARGPRRVPPSRGSYRGADDATRIVGGHGGPATTAVANPSIADAPTAMLDRRALADEEFPDPYGAPLPPPRPASPAHGGHDPGWAGTGYDAPGGYGSGGYGAGPTSGAAGYGGHPPAGGGYGDTPTSSGGYGSTTAPGGTYGATGGQFGPGYEGPGGGYGDRYDAPTSRYGEPGGRYDQPTSRYEGGYGPDQAYGPPAGRDHGQEPWYGSDPGYGQEPHQAGGYGPNPGYDGAGGTYQGGYGSHGYDERGAYGAGGPGGYDAPGGGYGQQGSTYGAAGGGYDNPGGYGQVPEQRGYPGYEQDQGGYYRGNQEEPRRGSEPSRSERRQLGWLDD